MKTTTGIPGLDIILKGGLEKGTTHLVKGGPGSGKTIFGLQFLIEGLRRGEKCVYITFDESVDEIIYQANSFGWDTKNILFVDMLKKLDIYRSDAFFLDYDSRAEIIEFIDSVTKLDVIENADRVFIDGIGAIRDIVKDEAIYRRVLSSIIQYLNSRDTTTMISSEKTDDIGKEIISYVVSGEFHLEKVEANGKIFRTIDVLKSRSDVVIGRHYFDIKDNGIVVYPIILHGLELNSIKDGLTLSTGNAELDSMLGGGILSGSKLMISGKSGVGKTNLCLQILMQNDFNNTGILYTFKESREEIMQRYEDLFNYKPERLVVKECEDMSSVGEVYWNIIHDLKSHNPTIIAIDCVNTLSNLAINSKDSINMLRTLNRATKKMGVTMLAVVEITQEMDVFHLTGLGISRFADYLIYGRYIEKEGELLKAITVIKNRFGNHERTFRILDMKKGMGLKIEEPLKEYSGLLSGKYEKSA
ncbi:hypothetical protein DRP05_00330 [Archaeoglobales archaeon]|nr:MAG: hypothetical protein DRP05_00330 [Archaeoglobales archaeon]